MLAPIQLALYDGAAMGLLASESKPSGVSPVALPQLVPDAVCAQCEVCCRFPEAGSALRPFFTAEEIAAAVAAGLSLESFPDRSGSQINVLKNPVGEGYICPAFDPRSGRCGIYEVRPLDCRLYPLALMWDMAHKEVVLGWDTKCPFMRQAVPATIIAHAQRVAEFLANDSVIDTIAANPRLIGHFQDDVVVVRALPQLTARLLQKCQVPSLHALTPGDLPRFSRAVEQAGVLGPEALAAYAFPYHYIWTPVLPYRWLESDGTFFLFAQSPDGWFMPLPPMGAGPLEEAVGKAFQLMRRWNGPSPVNRIENVMASQKMALERIGIRCRQKEGEYLYQAGALATLAGDRYKSQRALCNRVEREQNLEVEPFGERHREGCWALYERWAEQKRAGVLDETAILLLQDAKAAHALVFAEHERIGLSGTVAVVQERVVAYTFGYWLTPRTWCVLLEVADRSIPGLAQWLFRETCRAVVARGAIAVNTMDDAGLPGLRNAKRRYRPTVVLENWVVTDC